MRTIHALVACSDLTGFAKFAAKKPDEAVFQFLSDYYEFLGDRIQPADGKVIKFMGDAALIFFPAKNADAGIRALLALQAEGDRYLAERGVPSRHHIRAHFGPACLGEIGTRTEKRLDLLGSTVNTLFLLKAQDFALTPETFRQLAPETRTLFKKHTPPVTYIPTSQRHRD